MKNLTIPKIESPESLERLNWNEVGCANWPEFPDGPRTLFKAARTDDSLHILFRVEESAPRAVCSRDFDNVWEDSCVEFFCQIPGEDRYRNFEFNSRGVCVAASRLGQSEGVIPLSGEQMGVIGRRPCVFSDRWELLVSLPLDLVAGSMAMRDGAIGLRGNFYKCGDMCERPHFLSWAPVATARPLFHCPEFFGSLTIEG